MRSKGSSRQLGVVHCTITAAPQPGLVPVSTAGELYILSAPTLPLISSSLLSVSSAFSPVEEGDARD